MSETRLPTGLWVESRIRNCQQNDMPVYVIHRGEYNTGTVLLKINSLNDGCQVLTQARDENGQLTWFPALNGAWVAESEADAYIHRALGRDPDLWAIEIENRAKTNPFE